MRSGFPRKVYPMFKKEKQEVSRPSSMNGPDDNAKRFALSSGPFILEGQQQEFSSQSPLRMLFWSKTEQEASYLQHPSFR